MRSFGPRRLAVGLAVGAAVVGCGSAGTVGTDLVTPGASAASTTSAVPTGDAGAATAGAPAHRSLTRGDNAWVAVSVATLWRSASAPRAVDAPALANPVRIRQWLASMTLDQRRGLAGRADSEALLGDRVRVLRLKPRWAKVAVPSQPTPLDRRGYPGWVPRRQLTATAPPTAARQATVLSRTAWLRADAAGSPRVFPVSFGTRLPVVAVGRRWVRVSVPGGVVRRLARTVVVVHDRGTPALAATRASLVSTARSFVGLGYLWSGLSGFGVDCSGLTWLDYRVHGIRIPRDAAPQSSAGRAVATARRGDLLFFARDGVVHHVAMYVGKGRMVHAPHTGSTVQVAPTSSMAGEYAGARRYLP